MDILVDYNNLEHSDRVRGPVYAVDKILTALGPTLIGRPRIDIRLYDGWYLNRSLTRIAQSIVGQLLPTYPKLWSIADGSTVHKVIVNVELAYSIKADPANHLWHTFRPRSGQSNLTCVAPTSAGCTSSRCPLLPLPLFLGNGVCPETSCTISSNTLIVRNEQKLVDAMLAADLLFSHILGKKDVAIITSDDDLWPAIKMAVAMGVTVYHVHTDRTRLTPSFYTRTAGPKYKSLSI